MTKRVLVLIVLVLNFTIPDVLGRADAFSIARRYETCRFESLDGHGGYNQTEIRNTIACAVNHYNVPGGFGTVFYIAERESGLFPHAVSPNGCCLGIYQQHHTYWPGRLARFRRAHPFIKLWPSPFAVRSNVLVSVWEMHVDGVCSAWC